MPSRNSKPTPIRQRDRFGRVPYVTAEQKDKLTELHKTIAQNA